MSDMLEAALQYGAACKRLVNCKLENANEQITAALFDEIKRLRAELAEAKKFKDGMLDVLGGACPNDHRSTPFEEFKGCTPCLRAERAELLAAIEAMRVAGGAAEFQRAFDEAKIIAARKGEGE